MLSRLVHLLLYSKRRIRFPLREDTHKFFVFCLSGRTTLTTKQKPLISWKEKIYEKKYETLRSRGEGYQDLSGPTTKKTTFFMSVFPKKVVIWVKKVFIVCDSQHYCCYTLSRNWINLYTYTFLTFFISSFIAFYVSCKPRKLDPWNKVMFSTGQFLE